MSGNRAVETGCKILNVKMQPILRAILALAASGMAAQVATGIHLQDVRFKGDTQLEGVGLKKCASALKSQLYVGADWIDYFVGTVKTKCLLDQGYFKSAVTATTRQLPEQNSTHQFAVTFDIHAGPRYRLGHISFRGNHAISDAKLRDLFPLGDGSILNRMALEKGLENLRDAHQELGYINFTVVPATTFDDEKKLGFLEFDLDEGKQFYVSSIGILGADPQVLNDLLLTKGQVYNVRLVNQFLRKHLAGVDVKDGKVQQRVLDERNGTVALTFDFRGRTP